jgi:hypothetical protein
MFRDLFNQPWLLTGRPDGIVLPTLAFADWKTRLQAGTTQHRSIDGVVEAHKLMPDASA